MAKQTWKEFVIGYKNYKKSQGASTKLTEAEISDLRKTFTRAIRESKKPVAPVAKKPVNYKPETLKEAFEGMSNWKANNGLNAKLTESEKRAVAKAFRAEKATKTNKFDEACKEYKAYKESRGNMKPLTEGEKSAIRAEVRLDFVKGKIKEASAFVKRAERRLTEGDVMGAADMTQQAGTAINDATALDPSAGAAPTSPLPQNIVDEIQNIKSAVDALATEAGIESPVNLDADPNAGVPATTGVADPNAQAPAPAMAESINSAMSRIKARDARLAENAASDAINGLQKTVLNGGGDVGVPNGAIASTATKEEIKVPGTQSLLKGTVVGPKEAAPAKTWPTRPAKGGESKKLGNIEESDENINEEEQEELKESWAEKQVEARMAPKFNWNEYLESKALR